MTVLQVCVALKKSLDNHIVRLSAVAVVGASMSFMPLLSGGNATASQAISQAQAENNALTDKAAQIMNQTESAPQYTGIVIGTDGKVFVYATTTSAAFKAQATRNIADTRNIVFVQTTHSAQQLAAAQSSITKDIKTLESQGIKIATIYVSPQTDSLIVGVESPSSTALTTLQQRYGSFVKITADKRYVSQASRLDDDSPWNGGDLIRTTSGAGCTLGPAVTSGSGQHVSLTAGHCFLSAPQAGRTPFNNEVFQGNDIHGMGFASAELTDGGYDDSIVNSTSSGTDWETEQQAQVAPGGTAQKSTQRSVIGASVCESGSYSGENCGVSVTAVDATTVFTTSTGTSYSIIHTVLAQHLNVPVTGPGDSGGPVYQPHANGLFITGVHLGGHYSGSPGVLACEFFNTGARFNNCSDSVVYMDINSLLVHIGYTLYTL